MRVLPCCCNPTYGYGSTLCCPGCHPQWPSQTDLDLSLPTWSTSQATEADQCDLCQQFSGATITLTVAGSEGQPPHCIPVYSAQFLCTKQWGIFQRRTAYVFSAGRLIPPCEWAVSLSSMVELITDEPLERERVWLMSSLLIYRAHWYLPQCQTLTLPLAEVHEWPDPTWPWPPVDAWFCWTTTFDRYPQSVQLRWVGL